MCLLESVGADEWIFIDEECKGRLRASGLASLASYEAWWDPEDKHAKFRLKAVGGNYVDVQVRELRDVEEGGFELEFFGSFERNELAHFMAKVFENARQGK